MSGAPGASATTGDPSRNVVVVGSINMDLVVEVTHIPFAGETLMGDRLSYLPGGKGANQAVAAARMAAPVSMIGRLGADGFGNQLRAGLIAEHIETSDVGTCKHDPSGIALITVGRDGENVIVVAPGANGLVRTAHIDDAFDHANTVFVPGTIVVMQLEIPLDVVRHCARRARVAGCTVMLNPAPAQALPDDLLADVDILIANETEVDLLGGIQVLAAKVPIIVATLGARGLEVHNNGVVQTILGHRVDVVDTTGAGDATCGALAAAMASGRSVIEAARIANAAGALTTMGKGARTSPTSAELAAFLADQ
jgi:ribokinase